MLTQEQKDKRVAVAQKAHDDLKERYVRLRSQAEATAAELDLAEAELEHRKSAPVKAEKPVAEAVPMKQYTVTDIR